MLKLHLALPADFAAALSVLARFLAEHPPQSPLRPVPVLVGDPMQGAWLRTWLAQHDANGVAAGLAVAPANVAIRGLLARAHGQGQRAWWQGPPEPDPWSTPEITRRILAVWAAHPEARELEQVRRYTSDHPRAEVRRVLLAERAARHVGDLLENEPREVLAWAAEPVPEDATAWLRFTLRHLDLAQSPAAWRGSLDHDAVHRVVGGPLAVVGLADAAPHTVDLLTALGERGPVCWLRPSTVAHLGAPSPLAARAQALELRRTNPALPAHTVEPRGAEACSATLAAWRSVVHEAQGSPPRIQAPDARLPQLLPAWSPRREVEQLREQLLRHFDPGTPEDPRSGIEPALAGLEPRDVRILTPDLGLYGPLLLDVFSQSKDDRIPGRSSPTSSEAASPPARQNGAVPEIPLQLVGLGLTAINPVAAALLAALDALTDRVTLPGWVALLSMPQVRRRFGLGHIEPVRLRALLRDSGARWGFDGDDRGRVYGVPQRVHGLEFGLERLALGVLVHDELDPGSEGLPTTWGPEGALLFPSDAAGRDELAELGALQIAFETLRTWQARLRAGPGADGTWPELIEALLDDLVTTGESTRFLQQQVIDSTREALPPQIALDARTVTSLLRDRFTRGVPGDAKGLAGVQVATLEEAHALPARLVVLLGMGSGVFPRRDDRPSWLPPTGTPSRPERDRQAFTAAVLAARSDLWITWTAREPRRGEPLPPSSLVEDLIDAVAQAAGPTRHGLEAPWGRHRWSTEARTTFSHAVLATAGAVGPARQQTPHITLGAELPRPISAASNPEGHPPARTMTLDQLADRLLNPSQTLLRERLGVWLSRDEEPLADHDPGVLGEGLARWTVDDALVERFRRLGHDADPEPLRRVFVGKGQIPDGGLGAATLATRVDPARELVEGYFDLAGKGSREALASDPVEIAIGCSTVRLTARLPEAVVGPTNSEGPKSRILRFISASNPEQPKQLLRAFLHLLFANAQRDGRDVAAARIFGFKGKEPVVTGLCLRLPPVGLWHRAEDPVPVPKPTQDDLDRCAAADRRERAVEHLRVLVETAIDAERRAVPLFPTASCAAVRSIVGSLRAADADGKAPDPANVLRDAIDAAEDAWSGSFATRGDRNDGAVAALHPDLDLRAHLLRGPAHLRPPQTAQPDDALALALRVWWPVVVARHTGQQDLTSTPLAWSKA